MRLKKEQALVLGVSLCAIVGLSHLVGCNSDETGPPRREPVTCLNACVRQIPLDFEAGVNLTGALLIWVDSKLVWDDCADPQVIGDQMMAYHWTSSTSGTVQDGVYLWEAGTTVQPSRRLTVEVQKRASCVSPEGVTLQVIEEFEITHAEGVAQGECPVACPVATARRVVP